MFLCHEFYRVPIQIPEEILCPYKSCLIKIYKYNNLTSLSTDKYVAGSSANYRIQNIEGNIIKILTKFKLTFWEQTFEEYNEFMKKCD